MKIMPVASPGQIPTNGTPEHVRTAKAIAAFNSAGQVAHQQPQQQVVQNQSAITAEELGAIQPKTEEIQDNGPELEAAAPEETVEAPAPKAEDPALSRQFAQLARQERTLRAKQQQLDQAHKQRMADLDAREAALKGQNTAQDLSNYITKDRIKQDALSVLDEAGVSYDDLTQQIISRQPTDPRVSATISKLEAKIAQLEEANKATQTTMEERQQASYQAAVKQIEMDAKSLVKNDPNFETIKETGSVKDVVELITQTYEKDGILLTVEEAAEEVENYLVEQAMKLTRIEKIKRQLAQSSATTKPATQQIQPKQQTQPQMKTLTNAASSTRQLSARERALLAFKGELKS